jgi:hypothetical protein
MVRPSPKAVKSRSSLNLAITRLLGCPDLEIGHQCVGKYQPDQGAIMAKRKKGSKVQSRAKQRRANSAKRGKARKAAQAKTVAKAKPKRAPVKKAARKVKPSVTPAIETSAAEVVEQPVAVADEASTGPAM